MGYPEESGESRLNNESRTGPGPKWEQAKGSVSVGSWITSVNRLELTARLKQSHPYLLLFFFFHEMSQRWYILTLFLGMKMSKQQPTCRIGKQTELFFFFNMPIAAYM